VSPGDAGVGLVVLSVMSVDDQSDFLFAHEALCSPHDVVLYLQLQHAVDGMAAVGIVKS